MSAIETTFVDWSSLPRDMLVSIAKLTLMISVEAFRAFRATCSSWKEATGDYECVRWPRVPFLMFPEKAEFYSLWSKESWGMKISLPGAKFFESRFGWVLTLAPLGKTYLLYPFSGERIQLPDHDRTISVHYDDRSAILISDSWIRSVVSANPSETSDYVLVVLFKFYVYCWWPGDEKWTNKARWINNNAVFVDLIYYKNDHKFYAITSNNQLWVWDMSRNSMMVPVTSLSTQFPPYDRVFYNAYLVESPTTELLLVRKDIATRHFEVHRLDVIKGVTERKTRLKEAIFVGRNVGFSILPDDDDPVINSGCIYFTTGKLIGRPWRTHDDVRYNMGIYNLEDGTIQLYPQDDSDSSCFETIAPIWVAPSLLIIPQ